MACKKILSLDGGGIRGLLAAAILHALEKMSGKPTHEMFDVITGTSTGAFIGLMAAADRNGKGPYTAEEILSVYRHDMGKLLRRQGIWGALWPKYRHRPACRELDRNLEDSTLSTAKTEVIVPAFAISEDHPRNVVFSTIAAKSTPEEDFLMKDVARGAIAAPGFLRAHEVVSVDGSNSATVIDGGIYINNPTIKAWLHAFQSFMPGQEQRSRARFEMDKSEDCHEAIVVSIGTGRYRGPVKFRKASNWGLLRWWAFHIGDVVWEGHTNAVNAHMNHAEQADLLKKYYRLQPDIDTPVKLDDLNSIDSLFDAANRYITDNTDELNEIAALL